MKLCSTRDAISLSLCLLLLQGAAVHARSGGGGHGGHGGHSKGSGHVARGGQAVASSHWHGRGVTAARPMGAASFHRGYWTQGVRGGYSGWWWVAGPAWYLYPAPVYPYPAAVSDTVIYEPGVAYYCGALQAYFPDVNTCPEPWMAVAPAVPAPAY